MQREARNDKIAFFYPANHLQTFRPQINQAYRTHAASYLHQPGYIHPASEIGHAPTPVTRFPTTSYSHPKLFSSKTTQNSRVKPPNTPENAKHPINKGDFQLKIVAELPRQFSTIKSGQNPSPDSGSEAAPYERGLQTHVRREIQRAGSPTLYFRRHHPCLRPLSSLDFYRYP